MLVQWYYWKASFACMTVSRFCASFRPFVAAILASYSHCFNQPASKSIIRFLYPAPIASFLNHALITNWSGRFISICNALNCHIFQQCTGVISTFAILLRFDSHSAFFCCHTHWKHCCRFLWCTFRKHTCTKRSILPSFSLCNHKALNLINRHNIHPKISPFTESWMAAKTIQRAFI